MTERKLKPEIRKNIDINIDEVRQAILDSTLESSIYIGCDSVVLDDEIAYVTVVIIHYDSNHGGKIFRDIQFVYNHGNLRQRLMYEVYLVADIGYKISDTIGDRNFEVHLDINPNDKHKSNLVMKEAVGYILGMFGFKPKLKPHAFAASGASDHFAVAIRDNAERRKRNRKKRREWKRRQSRKFAGERA